jgi:hypothetical protein
VAARAGRCVLKDLVEFVWSSHKFSLVFVWVREGSILGVREGYVREGTSYGEGGCCVQGTPLLGVRRSSYVFMK